MCLEATTPPYLSSGTAAPPPPPPAHASAGVPFLFGCWGAVLDPPFHSEHLAIFRAPVAPTLAVPYRRKMGVGWGGGSPARHAAPPPPPRESGTWRFPRAVPCHAPPRGHSGTAPGRPPPPPRADRRRADRVGPPLAVAGAAAPPGPCTRDGGGVGGGGGQGDPLSCRSPSERMGRGGGGGCIRREGASEAAPAAVGQADGGGCQSGWAGGYCRLQMPLRPALGVRGTVAGHRLGALEEGGGGLPPPPFQCVPLGGGSRLQRMAHAGPLWTPPPKDLWATARVHKRRSAQSADPRGDGLSDVPFASAQRWREVRHTQGARTRTPHGPSAITWSSPPPPPP